MSIVDDALKKAGQQKKKPFLKEPFPSAKKGSRGWFILIGLLVIVFLFLAREFLAGTITQDIMPNRVVLRQEVNKDISTLLPKKGIIAPKEKETITLAEKKVIALPGKKIMASSKKEIIASVETGIIKANIPPELFLSGIMYEDEEPLAFINDRILKEGELIKGAKVMDIKADEVVLRFKEKKFSLFLRR
ncbi:MAG: general secretion pathway protein GspB [Candidatus Omnitrophota bacterium]|nr:general secretion pathway protein GspB [Candidatus Omnitrophota bacterium]